MYIRSQRTAFTLRFVNSNDDKDWTIEGRVVYTCLTQRY